MLRDGSRPGNPGSAGGNGSGNGSGSPALDQTEFAKAMQPLPEDGLPLGVVPRMGRRRPAWQMATLGTQVPKEAPREQEEKKTIGPDGNGHTVPVSHEVVEIDFAELEDGSLVELVEDPGDPMRTLLAVWQNGHVRYSEKLEQEGKTLVPLQRRGEILKHLRLARGTRPYETVWSLQTKIISLISRCVALHEGYVRVLADFVLSTWVVDRLPVAPYVSLVGLPQSGKTTLLKVLSLVCRRPLLTADITSAAFYEACARFTPTLLIDETGTQGSNRVLRHLLRMGTTRDVVAMRKNQAFHAYGAKVISWLEPPDDPALNSRCILIPMTEANRPDLVKPNDPILEVLAAELQDSLLQFRFDHYTAINLPEIPGAERLRPRARDLLTCLAAPCVQIPNEHQFLRDFFEFESQVAQEPLSPAHNAVLRALFHLVHKRSDADVVLVADLTTLVNSLLKAVGERFQLQPRKVGAVMTSLGFSSRQRSNRGWTFWLTRSDQQKVHELAMFYGVDRLADLFLEVSGQKCPMCQEAEGNRFRGGSGRKNVVNVVNDVEFFKVGKGEKLKRL